LIIYTKNETRKNVIPTTKNRVKSDLKISQNKDLLEGAMFLVTILVTMRKIIAAINVNKGNKLPAVLHIPKPFKIDIIKDSKNNPVPTNPAKMAPCNLSSSRIS